MLKNYLKTTLRSLRKNKVFSVINVFGLAVGLTAAVFIFQYAIFELSYDSFHEENEEVYRVINDRYRDGELIQSSPITYSGVGPQMAADFPEVVLHTTLNPMNETKLKDGEKILGVKSGLFVHQSFFDMFDFRLLAGDRGSLVTDLYSIVLTESVARNLFNVNGNDFDAIIGKLIYVDQDSQPTEITGVIEDAPANSQLQFEILSSRETLISVWPRARPRAQWRASNFYHYLQLVPGTDEAALEAKFDDFSKRHLSDEKGDSNERFSLQALTDAHLYSQYQYDYIKLGDGRMIWALIIVALFILVMAWINYVNLSTSRALERAKEVGVRKVIGARKRQLIGQFMMEAVVTNLIAVLGAFTLIQTFQSNFNALVDEQLSIVELLTSRVAVFPFWVLIVGLLVLGISMSGLYPAFVLSSYKPLNTLKGNFRNSAQGIWLKKVLVVFQFCISTLLVAGTLLVYQQVNFMRQQDLGMDMDHAMVLNGPSLTGFDSTSVTRVSSFKSALAGNPNVLEVGVSHHIPGERLPRIFNVKSEGSDVGYELSRINADYGFIKAYDIELAAGRNFRLSDHHADEDRVKNVMINLKAARQMGFSKPEEAVGKKVKFWGRDWFIIGVTADFHFRSLKESMEPILFVPFYDLPRDHFSIKLAGQDLQGSLTFVKSIYEEHFPGNVFEFNFIDDSFNSQYQSDERFGTVFNFFALLAILLASLGLFGLTGYSMLQRAKELGIRKVLGATAGNIVAMLSKDVLWLVGAAVVLALPITFLGARVWLSNYAFRTEIGPWLFVPPMAIILSVTLITIGYHVLKSARKNPVHSLRCE
ncbi:MAG: FtsX-like permease family protein [Roseivirga sp.]|nr:FtsX-like permease family protein [Roseivirga sp.]